MVVTKATFSNNLTTILIISLTMDLMQEKEYRVVVHVRQEQEICNKAKVQIDKEIESLKFYQIRTNSISLDI